MLSLDTKWVWDSWYCQDDSGLWHGYFLQADRALGDPELRHWNVSHGHATSTNLTDWRYDGTVFAPSPTPAFDDLTVWTGCVVRAPDGLWTMFYTGTSRAEAGKVQRIGRATSPDLVTWTRQGLALERAGAGSDLYEGHVPGRWKDCSLRDPWVIPDPDGPGWLMYFTARSPLPDDTLAAGAIGLARSDDLIHWEFLPPAYVGSFGEIEVPHVVRRGEKWFCLFCTTARYWSDAYRASHPGPEESGIHYLVADSARGPWHMAPGRFLLGSADCDLYAGRLLSHQGRDVILAFNAGPADRFAGTICDPIPVRCLPDGRIVPETRT